MISNSASLCSKKRGFLEIRDGIVFFEGNIAGNLLFNPMVSNAYFIEDGEEAILFDPSCGKKIARRIENYIQKRHATGAEWKKSFVIIGHSHYDHAGNLYLSDVMEAKERHLFIHENGYKDGRVTNEMTVLLKKTIEETKRYYNPYLSYYCLTKLLMLPFAALDSMFPGLTAKIFSRIGSAPVPAPVPGSTPPEPLREDDMQNIAIAGIEMKGWRLGDKVILPAPGHSPCSISLFWPERKAFFISDADWIGNPVFMSGSFNDCIMSLEKVKQLTESGQIDLLLPAHGVVKEGSEAVLSHINFHIERLHVIRSEILSVYRSCGSEMDVCKLTKILVHKSPFFRMLKHCNFPKTVVLLHNMVALCLKEEGILK